MEVYGTSFNVQTKKDASPVTIADVKAHDIIVAALSTTQIPILSEEGEIPPYEVRKSWERCWIVDPLDGTKEFVNRNGEFTVNIALVEDGKPIFGVIYIPVLRMLYVGNVVENKMEKVAVTENGTLQWDEATVFSAFAKLSRGQTGAEIPTSGIRIAASKSHMNRTTERYINKLKEKYTTVELVRRGSSLKFCLLAEGEIDVYPRFSPTMEWDTAAGHAICNAVGIAVIDESTGMEIVYNRKEMKNGSFVAENRSI
ncbi:3'(2'),5'-bisphosphate nucleotidase [Dokdonia sinensis]|uniref:3'(2'),5'-bisphosphate nucleotidase CysQ n=2 Tax=Dokdonia sinensis TaxID=2479847 RepID=A0A3M0GGF3_9FLAO|nr:3'(2'),5'-bisphosphate nucleotidase [Dokdonia sinensis]